jgi:hypothetical protein
MLQLAAALHRTWGQGAPRCGCVEHALPWAAAWQPCGGGTCARAAQGHCLESGCWTRHREGRGAAAALPATAWVPSRAPGSAALPVLAMMLAGLAVANTDVWMK